MSSESYGRCANGLCIGRRDHAEAKKRIAELECERDEALDHVELLRERLGCDYCGCISEEQCNACSGPTRLKGGK